MLDFIAIGLSLIAMFMRIATMLELRRSNQALWDDLIETLGTSVRDRVN